MLYCCDAWPAVGLYAAELWYQQTASQGKRPIILKEPRGWGCSSSHHLPWARWWINHCCLWRVTCGCLPSRIAHKHVPLIRPYQFILLGWHRHMCVNNNLLSWIRTRDLLSWRQVKPLHYPRHRVTRIRLGLAIDSVVWFSQFSLSWPKFTHSSH